MRIATGESTQHVRDRPAGATRNRRRSLLRRSLLCAAVVLGALLPTASAASAQTIVSLTFDDGTASQYVARSLLASHGMKGTFYLNSPRIGTSSYYMTWAQVQGLYADGNEIGGHTAFHADLPKIDPTEAQREICNDRVNLLNQGYAATDFAYPYGDYSPAVETMVQNCGYNSARSTDAFGQPCTTCAETMPPLNAYAIRTGSDGSTLSIYENDVINAEQHGGGWVPLIFHQICNACDSNWISQADFTTFLTWLQARAGSGTVVRTVQQVVGGSVQAAVPGPPPPAAPNGSNGLRNASLEQDANGDQVPDCYFFDGYGNNSVVWTRTTDAHSGSFAEREDVTNYVDGDNKLSVEQDLGYCTPTVTPGHQYRITAWYKSNAPVYFTAFTRDAATYAYSYWNASANFAASSTWTQATWVTPAIPAGTNGISFGLTLGSNGSLTVDDLGIDDAASAGGGDTTAPTVSLTAPTAGSTVAGAVSLTASASDNVAVDHVDFLVDGTFVATSTGPFSALWNSRTVANGAHTVTARAVDLSGNSASSSALVFVSNSGTNLLQNPSLESASGSTPTCWLLGGYGTNTVTWTRTSDAHSGSFAEQLAVTSYTNGDRKLVNTQDAGACAPAVVPGHSYAVTAWYKSGAQPIIFAYYRNSAGAWVYWAQSPKLASSTGWTQATWSTPVVPAGATNISVGLGLNAAGSVTMDDFALYDNAPPPDTTPPISSISCGSGDSPACASGWYNHPVTATISASDDLGGSGVAQIRYTTDGSDPTATSGTVYAGPFSVTATTTVKYRAFDNAGNAEAVNSQLIQIETTPPASTIACNGSTCSSGFYSGSVSIALSATDTGGSGVAQIRYTTDGSDPTATSGSLYIGSFSLAATATVKYRAFDSAGNAEAVNAQVVRLDTTPPSSTITCNGSPCAPGYYTSSVFVGLSAADSGGAGVAQIRYTTDGSDPTATSGTVYAGPFAITSTTVIRYRAFDNAGNAEAVNSQLVQVDSTPPSTSIACGGAACGSGYHGSSVAITLSASDGGGSGVNQIRYTTDGSDPTATSGTVYAAAFSVASTTTVKYRAFDNAGNAEAVNTQLVLVDGVAPVSTISCDGSPCTSTPYAASVFVSLSASDGGGSGVGQIRYTTDGSDPTATSGTVYAGAFAITSTTAIRYRAFDNAGNAEEINSQTVQISTPAPSSTIACNGNACAGGTYNAAVSVTLSATDNSGTGIAQIRYTTDGTDPTATSGTVYAGAFSIASTTTVKYRAFDNAGNAEATNAQLIQVDTTAPTNVAVTSPTSGATLSGSVSLQASASDETTVDHVDFLVDGTVVGTAANAPYSLTWNSNSVADGSHTVSARAYDEAGNSTPSQGVPVTLANSATTDTLPPTSTIACNGTTCGSGWYGASVSVTLAASDTGGSGVNQIRYTTDGSTPTATSGTVYAGAFSIASTTTIKYRAFDNAGNSEAVNSQLVQIDTTPPTSTISCNGTTCGSGWYGAPVSVTLAANANGGSGISQIRYTTDGSTPTATSGTVYAGAFPIATSTTVKYRAFDNAGNAEATNNALIQVDTSPPTTTIGCNGAACSGWYGASVSVTLAASDAGGSGVAQIRYTTDGSDPTATTGTPYTGAFAVAATTTVKYRAYDNLGNAETVKSATIQIDTTAPTAVTLSTPTAGSVLGGSATLTATASDNVGIDHIDFLVDGQKVATATTSPWTANWNTAAVPDGTHAIAARAYDAAGNATTSSATTVTVANINLLQNPSLELATAGVPTCWLLGGYGTSTFTWTRTSDAHSGSFGERLDITSISSGDRKLVNTQDTGTCAPAVTPGHAYTVTAWYKATAQPVIFAYYRNSAGAWVYWAQSPRLATAAAWTQATWTTPPVPAGATNISVGIGMTVAGTLTMDDLGLFSAG